MTEINIDLSEFNSFCGLMHRRENFVDDAVTEGIRRADAYASVGGRRHRIKARRFYRGQRKPLVRAHRASPAQRGRMIEHVAYHYFQNWWGSW